MSDWQNWIAVGAGGLVAVAVIVPGVRMVRGALNQRRTCAVCGKTGWDVIQVPARRPDYRLGVDPPVTHLWVCSVDHLARWIDGEGERR